MYKIDVDFNGGINQVSFQVTIAHEA